MSRTPVLTPLAAMALMSLATASTPIAQQAEQGPKTVATAPRAMVSSSHREVTRVMLEVLRQDGNAIDAMITALILQPILEPQMER